jgi:Phage capsid family
MNARPIPLRPDFNAARDNDVRSLCRAVIRTATTVLSGHTRRAAVSPLTTDTANLGQTTAAFVSTLVGYSAGADLLERGLALQFANATKISLPAITPGEANWIGEGQPFPVQQFSTAPGATLELFKLGCICALTGEMVRGSNAQAIVRQALLDSLRPALDKALFSTAAGVADLRPPGLLNGIAALTPSAATAPLDAMVADLGALAAAVGPVAGKSSIVFITAPAQAVAIGLRSAATFAYGVLPSSYVAAKTVIAVAGNALASAVGGEPNIDISQEGIAHMETAPQPIVTPAGTIATPVASFFQTDSAALKCRWPISWALRDARGVAWLQNVLW